MTGAFGDNSFKTNQLGRGSFSRILGGVMFGLGWLLSPLTWWNDALINIPMAWVLASWVVSNGKTFGLFFLLFYWLTNIGGFILMYFGWRVFQLKKPISKKEMLASFFVSLVYTVVILILIKLKVIRPL